MSKLHRRTITLTSLQFKIIHCFQLPSDDLRVYSTLLSLLNHLNLSNFLHLTISSLKWVLQHKFFFYNHILLFPSSQSSCSQKGFPLLFLLLHFFFRILNSSFFSTWLFKSNLFYSSIFSSYICSITAVLLPLYSYAKTALSRSTRTSQMSNPRTNPILSTFITDHFLLKTLLPSLTVHPGGSPITLIRPGQ